MAVKNRTNITLTTNHEIKASQFIEGKGTKNMAMSYDGTDLNVTTDYRNIVGTKGQFKELGSSAHSISSEVVSDGFIGVKCREIIEGVSMISYIENSASSKYYGSITIGQNDYGSASSFSFYVKSQDKIISTFTLSSDHSSYINIVSESTVNDYTRYKVIYFKNQPPAVTGDVEIILTATIKYIDNSTESAEFKVLLKAAPAPVEEQFTMFDESHNFQYDFGLATSGFSNLSNFNVISTRGMTGANISTIYIKPENVMSNWRNVPIYFIRIHAYKGTFPTYCMANSNTCYFENKPLFCLTPDFDHVYSYAEAESSYVTVPFMSEDYKTVYIPIYFDTVSSSSYDVLVVALHATSGTEQIGEAGMEVQCTATEYDD